MSPERASGNNVYLPGDDRELFNIADLYDVGNDYLNVLEIPIVEGQYFTENTTSSQEILVSRNFIEYMKPFADWKDGAVGKTVQITGHDTKSESMPLFTIRGVFENFRLGSIAAEDPRAKIMFYTKGAAQHMVIRYHSLSSEALRKTQDLAKPYAMSPSGSCQDEAGGDIKADILLIDNKGRAV